MSNAFINYNKNKGFGTILKSYEHADRLYIGSGHTVFDKSPKFGFLYFVKFNINKNAIINKEWEAKHQTEVGLFAKKIDLPKFTISTETLNQYNRKTIIQKGISYNPINIDLHDDNINITHLFWVNYFKNYYVDGRQNNVAFGDTKYGESDYNYGRYDNTKTVNGISYNNPKFLESIEIFVMHQGNFTQYTLINPKIKDWKHDTVDQSMGSKILENKLTVEFETVVYNQGTFVTQKDGKTTGGPVEYFGLKYYDQTPGPHTSGTDVLYNKRGILPFDKPTQGLRFKSFRKSDSSNREYDAPPAVREYGNFLKQSPGLLSELGTLVFKNYVNQNGLTRQNATAYNIAGSLLERTITDSAGKYGDAGPENSYAIKGENAPGVFTIGGVGINIFKGFNTTVDGKIRANPSAIIFPPIGSSISSIYQAVKTKITTPTVSLDEPKAASESTP